MVACEVQENWTRKYPGTLERLALKTLACSATLGLSNIVTAAVWPDHIKCQFPAPYCRGLPVFDALEVWGSHRAPIHLRFSPTGVQSVALCIPNL